MTIDRTTPEYEDFFQSALDYYNMLRKDMATPGLPREKQMMYVPRIHMNESRRRFIESGARLTHVKKGLDDVQNTTD